MGNLVADYVAVGGGLAGRVTASHLDQSGKDAIFLETGPDPSDDSAIEYFLGVDRVHYLNTGEALGGGTVVYSGVQLRGDAADTMSGLEWPEASTGRRVEGFP
ncbi:hypothetical protein GGS26DRAFT_589064 [Hypomontagnella submonticulosa]|nr:hypothetical protein GGS26DRAFT_589064 [Hypomontagnella submonticulosa]